jgi:transcriptional regulator with XRE-family HTH domain
MESSKRELSKLVGSNIRSLRITNGMTIEKLAAEAGMEYTQLSRIELGQINTSLFQIYKISKALSVNMCELFINIK